MFRSLRWKFTAWYLATSVMAILLVGAAIFYAESQALDHRLEGSIRGAGDAARAATAANLQQPAIVDPREAATEAVETVAAHGGLNANDVHVVLLDPAGFVLSNPEDVNATALGRGGSIETALAAGEYWHTARVDGAELRVKTFPLYGSDGDLIGFVQAAKSLEDNNAALLDLVLIMIGGGLAGLVLFAVGGYLVAGQAILPVQQGYERQRRFVADASHELRTPLTVIRTNTGMLMRRGGHDTAIGDIDTEARYMSMLIDNLLSLANGDSGVLMFGAEPIDISEAARSAGRSGEALALAAGVTLRYELQAGVIVNSDADACREAVFILLDNAIKYTPGGGEVVLATRAAGNSAIIEVRDTGIGMTPSELAQATDRFYSADKARSRARGGAGLGLAIAKELMAALDGKLELSSAPGRGTTARLRFRLAADGLAASGSGMSPARLGAHEASPGRPEPSP